MDNFSGNNTAKTGICRICTSTTRKKLNGIWNALSAVKLKPAIYAKIPDV
jgi:hypothetical protein